ncbi:MAG: low molecular weight phosphotyrosine protein phosphatase [Erysipelotrichaceae bacterium]|nr:low molecular weight phosphotyrosine protein phosphatase [Erysipelotrichaceae bacterium]
MIKILFVCHGNICRSTMAESIMKELVRRKGIAYQYYIDSAATSMEEVGEPMYSPAARKLKEKGIPVGNHYARVLKRKDYQDFDLLIGMDRYNVRNMEYLFGGDREHRIRKMMQYAGSDRDVADPWYTGDFEATWQDLIVSIEKLIEITEK